MNYFLVTVDFGNAKKLITKATGWTFGRFEAYIDKKYPVDGHYIHATCIQRYANNNELRLAYLHAMKLND